MTPIRKLAANLPTAEGRTFRSGTEVVVTDEFKLYNEVRVRAILVANARYHVREEDLMFALDAGA